MKANLNIIMHIVDMSLCVHVRIFPGYVDLQDHLMQTYGNDHHIRSHLADSDNGMMISNIVSHLVKTSSYCQTKFSLYQVDEGCRLFEILWQKQMIRQRQCLLHRTTIFVVKLLEPLEYETMWRG